MGRLSCYGLLLQLCSLLLTASLSYSQDNCLGPGFTQTIPPQDELSQYSTAELQPGDRAIFTTLNFRCNGTLQSLTIPSEIRQHEHPLVDDRLEPRPSIWRFDGNRYHFIFESDAMQHTIGAPGTSGSGQTVRITDMVVSFNFTVMLQRNIQAGDVLGFQVLNSRQSQGNTVIEHLPLLYKPGPIPGEFTPIVIANFTPTSDPTTASRGQSTVQSPSDSSASVVALAVLFVLALIVIIALIVAVVVLVVMMKRRQTISLNVDNNSCYQQTALPMNNVLYANASNTCDNGALKRSKPSAMSSNNVQSEAVPTPYCVPVTLQSKVLDNESEDTRCFYVPSWSQRQDPDTLDGTIDDNVYAVVEDVGQSYYSMEDDTYWSPGETSEAIFDQMFKGKYLEIPPSSMKKLTKLGQGEFGEVFKGEWTSPTKTLTVALKSLKSSASDEERLKLLQEAAIMGQFIHPHIVRLYGVVTLSEPIMVAMEFLPGGDLRSHLVNVKKRSNRNDTELPKQLLKFCQEIADAMEYLSKKGFIHRDLAARNILLTADMKCKLADFGMSHNMDDDYYYKPKGGMIPVKWTAPEAILYRKYTTKSDVWSYGMAMYEIWSLGRKPFEGMNPQEVVEVFSTGYCQPPPPGCPRGVYAIMVWCWHPDFHSRVSFTEVVQSLNYDQRSLLQMDPSDKTGTPLSLTLGAPLEHGQDLHKDLQDTYKK